MNISDRMFYIMEQKKLKMVDLSNALGISKSVVSTWKSRSTNPPVEYTVRICDFLGVSPTYFLTGEECYSKSSSDIVLSREERELLSNYQKLDSRGRHRLHTVAYEELDRVNDDQQKTEHEKSNAG